MSARPRLKRMQDWWFGLRKWQQFALAAVVVGSFVALVSATQGSERGSRVGSGGGPSQQPESDSPSTTRADRCSRLGDNVLAYNTLEPGASRGQYLMLLHKLQRDCPEEAQRRGLTNEGAPQCERLDQENCTMYRSP